MTITQRLANRRRVIVKVSRVITFAILAFVGVAFATALLPLFIP